MIVLQNLWPCYLIFNYHPKENIPVPSDSDSPSTCLANWLTAQAIKREHWDK